MKIYLIFKEKNERIRKLINKYHLEHDQNTSIALIINSRYLELYDRSMPKEKSIKIDFISKKYNYRCMHSKKSDLLYKAIGIKKNYFPFILDATAGWGKDAFFLSFLGCKVIMIECNPIVSILLEDALERAYQDKKNGFWIKKRLNLIFGNSLNMLNFSIPQPDVIYLDPMYPVNQKKCLPKKNMQFLRKIVTFDNQPEFLLKISRKLAKKRVIVKRPRYAKSLSNDKVDFIIKNKNYRFDIYFPL
ncbi:16S rRNA methyltransferase [Buchnera aphidicola (Melanaphis sacchari)]|uniref:Ribosomal RNA small subunit methyltransferase J n=1 Tax=Buchnera aphidicola (Melanaphis sacchari) TaxID=2173854 RepID=A0A2U8DFZ1_9GAMM|nr:class I SAM-dependent methyltransferase [Buchnera aphidicola]AWH90242.1 16S rRNA methyltransferase [Buchnera aphidicola (Melanaphis sacchari)]